MTILPALTVWFALLAPQRDATRLAEAIDRNLTTPLFVGDETRVRSAALLTAIAFRESSLNEKAVGDHGKALCAFQLWAVPEANDDIDLCVSVAIERIRESMKLCPRGNELCLYAAGPRGLTTAADKTRRITSDRFNLAKWLVGWLKKREEVKS